MGNKLKAISKVSVALALLGAAVPAVEAAPTAMAAKKAKKSTKKSTKKAKKAKKTTKKVAKKTAAKKPAKKSVKKTTKKSAKKAVKKPVAKKPVKKAVKKPVAKTPAKKAVKKPVAKKPAKKVVKKTTTKKTAKKVVKHVTMADKYQPKVKSGTVNVAWGSILLPEDFITNRSSLPSYVYFDFLDPVNTEKGGTHKTRIQAEYTDGSKEVVGTLTYVVPMMDADKYHPTAQDVTVNYGDSFDVRDDAITNAPGYFPNDPALPQFEDADDQTRFDVLYDYGQDIDGSYKSGTYNDQIEVRYPDGSYNYTNKFKITVLPSDADKVKVSLKSSYFTVSSNEVLEHETDNGDLTLNDPTRFLNIGSALPEGTVIHFIDDDDLDNESVGPLKPKKYVTSLIFEFPDGSEYKTDDFTLDVK